VKKPLPIESLIKWSYTVELPKENRASTFLRPGSFGFGWEGVSNFGKYMGDVDGPDLRNVFGVTPDLTAQSGPHPDAIAIWDAVQELEHFQITIPEDWNPIEDLKVVEPYKSIAVAKGINRLCLADCSKPPKATLVSNRSAVAPEKVAPVRTLREPVVTLIREVAILNCVPSWESAIPELQVVKSRNGRPTWFIKETVDGNEVETKNGLSSRGHPKGGAYRKFYYDPDPGEVVEARGRYELWHAGISSVFDEVVGRLGEHEALPCSLSARPWEDGAAPVPKILVDMRTPQPVIRQEPRPIAGRPLKRGLAKDERAA
jgi:hypothetical protein